MENILTSVKKANGIEADDKHFDPEITLHINTVMLTLNQLGVGPKEGFVIQEGTEEWSSLLGDRTDLEAVKTLVCLKVKMIFDPPTISSVLEAMNRQIQELEWRVNIQADVVTPTIPIEGGTEYEE